jgi:hypothetical protein
MDLISRANLGCSSKHISMSLLIVPDASIL